MQRKFYCHKCESSFWAMVAENVAEEALKRACPECGLAVSLYHLAGPLTNKRISDWGLGEWFLAAVIAFLGYQGVKVLKDMSA